MNKNRNRKIIMIITAAVLSLTGMGCGKSQNAANCPFSELSWDSTTEDMIALEGDGYDTYDSIYKGITYTYPCNYLDIPGMVKYMYDDNEILCNISWSYNGVSAEDISKTYDAVCADIEKSFGKGNDDDGVGNRSRIWVTDSGTIMVSSVTTNDTNVMQIAFMRKEVSKQQKED